MNKKGEISSFKAKKKTGIMGLAAAVLIVLIAAYFVVSGYKIIKLNKELDEAETKKQELTETKEDLQAQYKDINSDKYIERLARRDLKLVKANELLFILPEETEEEEQDGETED